MHRSARQAGALQGIDDSGDRSGGQEGSHLRREGMVVALALRVRREPLVLGEVRSTEQAREALPLVVVDMPT